MVAPTQTVYTRLSKNNQSSSFEYVNKNRMISFYNQQRLLRALEHPVHDILEIGIFQSLLTEILRRQGYQVTTADNDPDLNPDIVLDLTQPFSLETDRYDVIVLFQVLEHIPYDQFERAVQRLVQSTRRYIVISLPYASWYFNLHLNTMLSPGRPRNLFLQIPHFWSHTPTLPDEHHWEIGLKDYPLNRIQASLRATGLHIQREFQDPLHPYHYFFVLEKSPSPSP